MIRKKFGTWIFPLVRLGNLRHLNLEHQKDIILGGENCSGTERLKIRWESSPIRSAVFLMKNFDYPEKPLKYKHIRRISD